MRIGTERDRNISFVRKLENCATRINFFAIFAQTSRVQFDFDIGLFRRVKESREKFCAIFFGHETEFLRQIGVADNLNLIKLSAAECFQDRLLVMFDQFHR